MSPWTEQNRLGRPVRKFVNGVPDPRYWQAGLYANATVRPTRNAPNVFEISPVSDRESVILPSASTRSLEIVKDPGSGGIRLLASASPEDSSYPAETGHECARVGAAAPEWVRDPAARAFDVELASQLNFAPVSAPPNMQNTLARTMAPRTGEGIWVQAVFESQTGILARHALDAHRAIRRAHGADGSTGIIARTLEPHYASRATLPLVALSIRGAFLSDSPEATLAALGAAFGSVSVEGDSLSAHMYDIAPLLDWLESRQLASDGAYDILGHNCAMWKDSRLGFGRDMSPVLVATHPELSALLRIPDDPALEIRYMRRRRGGAEEVVLGHDLASADYARLTESPASISPEHMESHTYLLGATGTGKTSLMRSLALHLCTPKGNGYDRAVIIVDVKDDDALSYLTQLDAETLDSGRVTYIDMNRTEYAINPLELPPHDESSRDMVVSRKIGQVSSLLKEVYSQQAVMVQVERLIRLLLAHLYSQTPSPTMADLYGIITTSLNDPTAAARRMATASPDLSQAFASLSRLPRDSWTPLINRIEPFAIDAYMKKRFSARHGTVDFARMLEPGQITIFRASEAETPSHVHAIMPTLIALEIWNALLSRAEAGGKRTPVTLFLDEFHMMRDVTLLKSMLSRGRSLGLGLVLAHQNLSQVDRPMLDMVLGNTSTHIHGRAVGGDARTIANAIDPAHAAEIIDQISGLPNHSFLISRVPPKGAERAPPVRFVAHAPPPRVTDDAHLAMFLKRMSDTHRPDDGAGSIPHDAWKAELSVLLPARLWWHIIVAMRDGGSSVTQLAESAAVVGLIKMRYEISSALTSMVHDRLVKRISDRRSGTVAHPTHALTDLARETYLPCSFGAIGRARGVEEAACAAFEHNVAKGRFAAIAAQGRTIGSLNSVDMIAYDYERDCARSVEVESAAEVSSHPEHVIHNMSKWEAMGFVGCDTWSDSPAVLRLREKVPEPVRSAVRCFVLQDGKWVCHGGTGK